MYMDVGAPTMLQRLIMEENSTFDFAGVQDVRLDIHRASFATGSKWLMRGEDGPDASQKRPSTPKCAFRSS